MQKLTINNGLITWVKPEPKGFSQRENLTINYFEIIDDNAIHLGFIDLGVFIFLVDDTELNGVIYKTSKELFDVLSK